MNSHVGQTFLKSPTLVCILRFLMLVSLLTELWHQQFTKYLFKWASRTPNSARLSSQVNGTSITASTEASRAGWRTSQYLFLSWTEASYVSRESYWQLAKQISITKWRVSRR